MAPQIYLTLDPGNAADLKDSFRYYVGARTQLATHPQVKARPDLGPGAFTLTVPDAHVTNAFFLSGDNIATLSLDLTDSPRPERLAVAQILALAAAPGARLAALRRVDAHAGSGWSVRASNCAGARRGHGWSALRNCSSASSAARRRAPGCRRPERGSTSIRRAILGVITRR